MPVPPFTKVGLAAVNGVHADTPISGISHHVTTHFEMLGTGQQHALPSLNARYNPFEPSKAAVCVISDINKILQRDGSGAHPYGLLASATRRSINEAQQIAARFHASSTNVDAGFGFNKTLLPAQQLHEQLLTDILDAVTEQVDGNGEAFGEDDDDGGDESDDAWEYGALQPPLPQQPMRMRGQVPTAATAGASRPGRGLDLPRAPAPASALHSRPQSASSSAGTAASASHDYDGRDDADDEGTHMEGSRGTCAAAGWAGLGASGDVDGMPSMAMVSSSSSSAGHSLMTMSAVTTSPSTAIAAARNMTAPAPPSAYAHASQANRQQQLRQRQHASTAAGYVGDAGDAGDDYITAGGGEAAYDHGYDYSYGGAEISGSSSSSFSLSPTAGAVASSGSAQFSFSSSSSPSQQLQLQQQQQLQSLALSLSRRRENLSNDQKDVMRAWFIRHIQSPYPNDTEKAEIAEEAGTTIERVTNWFINARAREWERLTKASKSSAHARAGSTRGQRSDSMMMKYQ